MLVMPESRSDIRNPVPGFSRHMKVTRSLAPSLSPSGRPSAFAFAALQTQFGLAGMTSKIARREDEQRFAGMTSVRWNARS